MDELVSGLKKGTYFGKARAGMINSCYVAPLFLIWKVGLPRHPVVVHWIVDLGQPSCVASLSRRGPMYCFLLSSQGPLCLQYPIE